MRREDYQWVMAAEGENKHWASSTKGEAARKMKSSDSRKLLDYPHSASPQDPFVLFLPYFIWGSGVKVLNVANEIISWNLIIWLSHIYVDFWSPFMVMVGDVNKLKDPLLSPPYNSQYLTWQSSCKWVSITIPLCGCFLVPHSWITRPLDMQGRDHEFPIIKVTCN